jgi:tetratricopeptide (TPR) repeat protein
MSAAMNIKAQSETELLNKALAFKKERKCTEAIPLLQKLLELNPQHIKALNELGWCLNENKQYTKAIAYLQKAIQIDSVNAFAFAEIGYSYYSIQEYTVAIGNLNIADKLNPKIETTIYYLGLCFVRLNSKAGAVKKYNELALLNSSYAGKLLDEIKAMK